MEQVRCRQPALFAAIEKALHSRLHELQPTDLSKLVWSFARAAVSTRALFAEAANVASTCVVNFSAHDMSALLWAYGKVAYETVANVHMYVWCWSEVECAGCEVERDEAIRWKRGGRQRVISRLGRLFR